MWGRTSRRHRRYQIARARSWDPPRFASRDWPTAPPAPPHKENMQQQQQQLNQKILLKRPSSASANAKPRPSLSLCSLLSPPPGANLRQKAQHATGTQEDGGGDAAGRRPLLRGAQQADLPPHHRRRRRRLRRRRRRRRAVPRRHAPPAGFLYVAPCAIDVGATGLHAVPPRRQLRQRRRRCWQNVAATTAASEPTAVRQQGHRRVHPAVHARRRALQAQGQELERLQGAQGAGAGRGRRRGRHARQETLITKICSKKSTPIKSKKVPD